MKKAKKYDFDTLLNDLASDFKILIEKLIANVKEFANEE